MAEFRAMIRLYRRVRLWWLRLWELAYNDTFLSVPANFLPFTCIRLPLYCHFTYSNAFCQSRRIFCSFIMFSWQF